LRVTGLDAGSEHRDKHEENVINRIHPFALWLLFLVVWIIAFVLWGSDATFAPDQHMSSPSSNRDWLREPI